MSAAEKLKALETRFESDSQNDAYEAEQAALAALPQIVAVVETSICHRFTTSSCLTRPEVDPTDYCASCAALSALDEALENCEHDWMEDSLVAGQLVCRKCFAIGALGGQAGMSAAEKLERLAVSRAIDWPAPSYEAYRLAEDAERLRRNAVDRALPQIVAVIEAADALPEFFKTDDGRTHSFGPLLDALEEKLP